MAITNTISRPAGGRVDDVRALRFRYRVITPTGTYATGGDTIQASAVGLKRVVAAIALNGNAAATDGATAEEFGIKVAANGTSFVLRWYENAATGLPSLEKTNTEAPITGVAAHVLFLGY